MRTFEKEREGYPNKTARMKVMAGIRLVRAEANVTDVRYRLSIYKF
jgi:hypothetical protein